MKIKFAFLILAIALVNSTAGAQTLFPPPIAPPVDPYFVHCHTVQLRVCDFDPRTGQQVNCHDVPSVQCN